jgi:putative transposase
MKKRIYPCDLSDGEFEYLKKCLPKQSGFGRPPEHTRREILNGIFYLLRTGCAWRYLPRDYPPWQTVYHYFRLWRKSHWWKKTNKRLRRLLRLKSGRAAQSSVGIIDSQSSKTVDTAREAVSFDGGKKVKGRKRHLLVDRSWIIDNGSGSRGRSVGNSRSKSGFSRANRQMVENKIDLARWRLQGIIS